MRTDFEHDLGVPGERDRARRARPGAPADEGRHARPGCRLERPQPCRAERLPPGPERRGQREPGAAADQQEAGRVQRDQRTVAAGQAGWHVVSLQRTIAGFVTTRSALSATSAQLRNPVITGTVHNGISSFIFVLKRGNYLVPVRARRSFPLLDAWQSRHVS